MIRSPGLVLLLAAPLLSLVAQEEPPAPAEPAPERPVVTKVGENLYRMGEIEIDSRTRELRIPVTVNMREGGPIEYVLVHENGKVHEAVFTTKVSPLHLQIALKLLQYEAGQGDVFNRLLAPQVLEKEGGRKEDRGEAVSFRFVMDTDEGDADAKPVSQVIIDGGKAEPMSDEPWIYTGSTIEGGIFMAEAEGSIIAVYLDHLALFNMTREGADNDERWGANSRAIPEIGTQGTVIIAPAENSVTN